MQLTLESITRHLRRAGWSSFEPIDEVMEEEGKAYMYWRTRPQGPLYRLEVDPEVERDLLVIRVKGLLPDGIRSEQLDALCRAIAVLNGYLEQGYFYIDPHHKYLFFVLAMPLRGVQLTEATFYKMLRFTQQVVAAFADELNLLNQGAMDIQSFEQFLFNEGTQRLRPVWEAWNG